MASLGRADARPLVRLGATAQRFGKREASARRRRVSPSLAIGALLTLALLVAAPTAPWLAVYPGLCLTLAVVGLNLLGDGLRDALDPRG